MGKRVRVRHARGRPQSVLQRVPMRVSAATRGRAGHGSMHWYGPLAARPKSRAARHLPVIHGHESDHRPERPVDAADHPARRSPRCRRFVVRACQPSRLERSGIRHAVELPAREALVFEHSFTGRPLGDCREPSGPARAAACGQLVDAVRLTLMNGRARPRASTRGASARAYCSQCAGTLWTGPTRARDM